MSKAKTIPIHWSFWLVAAFAIVWNVLGGVNLYVQITASDLHFMPDWARAVAEARPAWATAAMAIAAFFGVLGGLLLLLKKALAYYVFIVSAIGVFATLSHVIGIDGAGAQQIFESLIMPAALSIFFIFFTKMSIKERWIS